MNVLPFHGGFNRSWRLFQELVQHFSKFSPTFQTLISALGLCHVVKYRRACYPSSFPYNTACQLKPLHASSVIMSLSTYKQILIDATLIENDT